jgi:3-oxoacyl-ACP reductase-like protein
VADQASGIDLMRRRIERASRQPPPSRRPRGDAPETPAVGAPAAEAAPAPDPAPAPVPASARAAAPKRARTAAAGEGRVRLAPDLPPVNLAIRVRKPLDDALADTIHALRGAGVRTSKVELIEMLLWESAGAAPEAVRERLRTFREWAPRGAGARLDA